MDDDPILVIVVVIGIIIGLSVLGYFGIVPTGHRYM